jgi:hypothetical protein
MHVQRSIGGTHSCPGDVTAFCGHIDSHRTRPRNPVVIHNLASSQRNGSACTTTRRECRDD